jgi:hypothetical protein
MQVEPTVRDAAVPGVPDPPVPDAAPPVVELVFRNRSSAAIDYAFNGCDVDLVSVSRSQPAPQPSADEQQFWQDLAARGSCACNCSDLQRDEACTKDKCPVSNACAAVLGYQPIAPGEEITTSVPLFTTALDAERRCVSKLPYADGTELTAHFCWWSGDAQRDPGSTRSCGEVRFAATDAVVTFSLTDELLVRGADDAP